MVKVARLEIGHRERRVNLSRLSIWLRSVLCKIISPRLIGRRDDHLIEAYVKAMREKQGKEAAKTQNLK